MSSTSKNSSLSAARAAKQDEFYTQLADIERELKHYKKHFHGKTVYLNCDDPRVSNFFHYFSFNFERLGLKKLIAACYKSQEVDLFSTGNSERAIWLEYEGDRNGSGVPDPEEIGVHHFDGDGDFRSAESIELLRQADIVVTNPPFSLFREYVAQLMEHEKKFILIGPTGAITYKELFPLFKEDKIWLGNGFQAGNAFFATQRTPDDYAKGVYNAATGLVKFRNVSWFTNLDLAKRHEELVLYKSYDPQSYLTYDNYDAIEVSRIKDIPVDWDGAMGVPITFMEHYNPDQFEILGITDRDNNSGLKTKTYSSAEVPNAGDLNRRGALLVDGKLKSTFARLLIRKRVP
ncbi:adenine-specific methyltransferase EcoRI family protein [Microcella sp.]|uniref:adenine-specific methyltransferase EcoRI family protein n=1 Tax=Microcella sp. TaxID=1913979 RepID=UPI00391BD8DA